MYRLKHTESPDALSSDEPSPQGLSAQGQLVLDPGASRAMCIWELVITKIHQETETEMERDRKIETGCTKNV
jgi:hypothetical protein